jgi:hypothetical protein
MTVERLVLASSLPPQLRGQPLDPAASNSLQLRTLGSWLKAGFSPLSFHTAAELAAQPDHAKRLAQAGVAVLEVNQTDPEPLPNLLACLKALAAAHPTALLAITNADILLANGSSLPQTLKNLGPNQALIGRRLNVPSDADADANTSSALAGFRDAYGFDFFAVHTASLLRALPLIPEGLVFGRPWWDLFLPLALLAAGLELRDPGPDLFLHPNHQERWSAEQWFRFGQQADIRFMELLGEKGCHAFSQRWRRQRRQFILRWPGLTVLRHRFREQRRAMGRQGRLLPLYLSDVSDAINSLVEVELKK